MRFNLEHNRNRVEEASKALETSRVQLDALSVARGGVLFSAADLSTDMLDVNVREHIDEHISEAQIAVDKLIDNEMSVLKDIEYSLTSEFDLLCRAQDAANNMRASIEHGALEDEKEALPGELDSHKQQLNDAHEDIQRVLRDVDGLMDRISSIPLAADSYNPEGERRRVALDYLTDAADSLNAFEEYVLKDADEALKASRLSGSILVTGDSMFDAAFESYVTERTETAHLASSVGETRSDSIRESIEATSAANDAIGSLTSGVIAATAGMSLFLSYAKGKPDRKAGR